LLKNALLIYNAQYHSFGVRDLPNSVIKKAVSQVNECLSTQAGTVFWFVADLARSSRYSNPESLVWRDSGALLATIGFVAESLNLNCCGLGLHEIPILRRFLHLNESVIGVGGCIVSGRDPQKVTDEVLNKTRK
jgi:hypothetical protein